jgi:hypothetical protein
MLARDYYRCITPLSDGNFIMGGTSKREFSEHYGANLYKIDLSGNILWNKIYTANYDDATIGAFEQADQTRVLIIRHGVTGQPTKVIKTDDSGNTILGKYNMSTTNPQPGIVGDCAVDDGSGNYYIGGSALNGTTGTHIFFVCKVNDIAPIWYNEYDFGRNTAAVSDISILSDGNIAAIGYVAQENNTNIYSMAVLKLDPVTASVIWAKEIKQSEENSQYGSGILALANGEMIVYGGASTSNGSHAYTAKLSAAGNVEWAREYGGDDNTSFTSAFETGSNLLSYVGLAVANAGPYLVQTDHVGSSPCNTYNLSLLSLDLTVTPYPQDVITGDFNVNPAEPPYTEKTLSLTETTLCAGTSSLTEASGSSMFSIYPNPAHELVNVEMNEGQISRHYIEIYNIHGVLVSRDAMREQRTIIETPLGSGVYVIRIIDSKGQTVHRKEIIIQ